jgi:hypothetical protein
LCPTKVAGFIALLETSEHPQAPLFLQEYHSLLDGNGIVGLGTSRDRNKHIDKTLVKDLKLIYSHLGGEGAAKMLKPALLLAVRAKLPVTVTAFLEDKTDSEEWSESDGESDSTRQDQEHSQDESELGDTHLQNDESLETSSMSESDSNSGREARTHPGCSSASYSDSEGTVSCGEEDVAGSQKDTVPVCVSADG